MHNSVRMCSPGLTQPNDVYQPGSGPNGFTPSFGGRGYNGFNPPGVDTSGGMMAGQMPSQIKTPMGTLNNVHAIGRIANNPQISQQNQKTMGVFSNLGSFNAAKFIK